MIVGRPPQLGDQAFRVPLDAQVPFKLVDPPCPTISRTASSLADWAAVRAANNHGRMATETCQKTGWLVAVGYNQAPVCIGAPASSSGSSSNGRIIRRGPVASVILRRAT
jgi:hypothetical protein